MTYREVEEREIERVLFAQFTRRQEVKRCWRKENGEWKLRDIAFVDDWDEEDYGVLVACLKNTARTGGLVAAAFEDGALKGFASVESVPLGSRGQYADLSSIHVSQEMRGKGVGRRLFGMAQAWAKAHGAEKLYISAHSAQESQAFYRAMGCREAEEYDLRHTQAEPCDCQLECVL